MSEVTTIARPYAKAERERGTESAKERGKEGEKGKENEVF